MSHASIAARSVRIDRDTINVTSIHASSKDTGSGTAA
jgi:hypothetical protein